MAVPADLWKGHSHLPVPTPPPEAPRRMPQLTLWSWGLEGQGREVSVSKSRSASWLEGALGPTAHSQNPLQLALSVAPVAFWEPRSGFFPSPFSSLRVFGRKAWLSRPSLPREVGMELPHSANRPQGEGTELVPIRSGAIWEVSCRPQSTHPSAPCPNPATPPIPGKEHPEFQPTQPPPAVPVSRRE